MDAKRAKHDAGVSLPEDIIFDVLAWLPAKTLCRLRAVCKGWRALISDPAFVVAQRSRVAEPHLVGVFSGPRCLPELRVMDMGGNVVKAFGITMRSAPLLPTRLEDLICADAVGLPGHGGLIIDPAAGRAFSAFGTTDQPLPWAVNRTYSTSIGRATPSGVFKVLRLQKHFLMMDGNHGGGGGGSLQLCYVATITDGSGGSCSTAEPLTWRRKSAPPFVASCSRERKAIVKGVVYFMPSELAMDYDVDEDDDAPPSWNRIAAFDLESEEWRAEAINGPALGHHKEGKIWVTLVELNGTLGLVHDVLLIDPDKSVWVKEYTSIWLLIDPDKSVWVKEYTIQMPKNQRAPTRPLGVLVDGRILFRSSVSDGNEEETWESNSSLRCRREVVLLYNPSTKAFTDFMEMGEEFRYTLVFYSGSLLS